MALRFWDTDDEDEAAQSAREWLLSFADMQSSRRSLVEKYAQAVEGMTLTSLGPYGYSYSCDTPTFDDNIIPIIRNVGHELVDTIVSKVGAIDPPLPSNLTSKGSWRDRRQAADLEQLVRAEFSTAKCGALHPNLHSVWLAALRLAVGATGATAVEYFNNAGYVDARLHDTLDMAWSPDLRTQGCITWLPADDVKDMFPDSAAQIESCVGEPPPEWRVPTRAGQRLTDFVCLYQVWHGAGGGKDGAYVACLNEGPALQVKPYPHRKPPFVWLRCTPHLYGPLGHCLLHHVFESMRRDNLIISRVDKAIQKTNESTTFVDEGALAAGQHLDSTGDHTVVKLAGGTARVPTTVSPAGFSGEHLNVAQMHYEDAHKVSGLSEATTQGTRAPGIDSAIGQRYVAAIVNERFAALQRGYTQAVAVESAEVVTQILCEIYEGDPKLMRLAPGEDSLREISGAVALDGIESIKYIWRSHAVSGNKGNPADRMQSAYELWQMKVLTEKDFAGMQSQGFDLPETLDDNDIQRQWVERQMYRWQFASDDDVAKPDFYLPPFELMRIPEAMLRVIDGYLEAQMEELEPERLDFFLMFLADCSAITASNAPPEMPGAAPPMPGAPPALGVPPAPALPPPVAA
jgi:hypothetical protein